MQTSERASVESARHVTACFSSASGRSVRVPHTVYCRSAPYLLVHEKKKIYEWSKKAQKISFVFILFLGKFWSFFRDALLTLEYRRLALPALANLLSFLELSFTLLRSSRGGPARSWIRPSSGRRAPERVLALARINRASTKGRLGEGRAEIAAHRSLSDSRASLALKSRRFGRR
jgi:hypothetical protein